MQHRNEQTLYLKSGLTAPAVAAVRCLFISSRQIISQIINIIVVITHLF